MAAGRIEAGAAVRKGKRRRICANQRIWNQSELTDNLFVFMLKR